MRILRALVAAAAISSIGASSVHAACDDVPSSLRKDGAWLFSVGKQWRTVKGDLQDYVRLQGRRVFFTYVVSDEDVKTPRRGLVVIKSGYDLALVDRDGDTENTTLHRNSSPNVDKCETELRYFDRKVSSYVYDRYHDYGFKTRNKDQDYKSIEEFHIKYAARKGCKISNDARADIPYGGHWTSNRSQFSFDPKVVESGQHNQLLTWLGISPAYASQPISDRQVDVKKYAVDGAGLACVRFNLMVSPGRFVRINDLERRGLFRGNEQMWTWSK